MREVRNTQVFDLNKYKGKMSWFYFHYYIRYYQTLSYEIVYNDGFKVVMEQYYD